MFITLKKTFWLLIKTKQKYFFELLWYRERLKMLLIILNNFYTFFHIYFYKKLRIIYDQFGSNIFNNYDRNMIINNLDDLNNYIGEEDYEIIINMYINIFEFEIEKVRIKRKDTIRYIMLKSKSLCVDVINNFL